MKNFELPQVVFSKIFRAVVEFELIEDGDKILIGRTTLTYKVL